MDLGHLQTLKNVSNNVYKNGFINGVFSDITLCVLGHSFRLHRLILLQNEYFATMLDERWQNGNLHSKEKTLEIQLELDDENITLAGVTAILQRIYGHTTLDLNQENVVSILAAASFFADKDLAESCVRFIQSELSLETIPRYIDFLESSYYGVYSDDISDAVFVFLCSKGMDPSFPLVVRSLPFSLLERLFSSDAFLSTSELNRYNLLKSAYFTNPDERIKKLLDNCVLYSVVPFKHLIEIGHDRLVNGDTLKDALWDASELKLKIESADPSSKSLDHIGEVEEDDCHSPLVPTEDSGNLYQVAKGLKQVEELEKLPRFRFCWEFKDVGQVLKSLNGHSRAYSQLFFYAGSFWTVYLQAMFANGEHKLGIYLQRWAVDDDFLQEDALEVITPRPYENDDRDDARYIDKRVETKTWFKLYIYMRGKCFVLESKPDFFRHTQSWGWRSSKLYKDAGLDEMNGDQTIKVACILGHV